MSKHTENLKKRLKQSPPKKSGRKTTGVSSFLLPGLIGLSLIAVIVFGMIYFRLDSEYQVGNNYYSALKAEQVLYLHVRQSMDKSMPEEIQAADNRSIMDFMYLRIKNEDIVAWITAPGLPIDLPVVQGKDNSYYLTHLFDHQPNRLGTLFIDVQNAGNFSDKNTVIYGHNMNDGSMFASLANYRKQEFYESFPVMELYTPEGDYKIELFAGYVANGNEPFLRFTFNDETDFLTYIVWLKSRSTFSSSVDVKPHDRIITLATCSYEYDNARYVVFGKLIPRN